MQRTVVWKRRRSDQFLSFFLFMFEEKSNWEDHRCALTLLSWSLVTLSCLNAPSLSRFTTGRHRSEKEKLFKRILWIHLHHVCPSSLVDSFSLSFFRQCPLPCSSLGLCNASYCPIHSINNWEHFMQTVLVPWALWSRIHGTNAGWQASLRPRTPSPG